MIISREWEVPNGNTFSIRVIAKLLKRWLEARTCVVDPFARNSTWADYSNDLNPETEAKYHLDAIDFCKLLEAQNVRPDAILFDPPYSPRQISEMYKSIGRPVGTKDTQNAVLYSSVKDILSRVALPGAVAVSCGWNTVGFGKTRGWQQKEILIVCHGGAHNDTLVTVEEFIGLHPGVHEE